MELVPIPTKGHPVLGAVHLNTFAQEMCAANQTYYQIIGFHSPWVSYLAVEDGAVVGTCAFKGAPKNGVVEIAYGTVPELEGKGIATRMAAALVRVARTTDPGVRIIAQTLPEHNASTRVLTRNGFAQVRDAVDAEVGKVWEWELMG